MWLNPQGTSFFVQCLEDRIVGQQSTLLLMNQTQLTLTSSNSTIETIEKGVDFE